MDPAELLLSLPEWVLDIPVGAWFFFGLAALGILSLCVMSSGAKADVTPTAHDEQESTYGRYEDPAPRKTRREALDEVLAGRMEWDDYLAYFRGWPDDGSLTKKQERIAAALEKATSPKLELTYADNEVYTDFTTTPPKKTLIASGPNGEIKPPLEDRRQMWGNVKEWLKQSGGKYLPTSPGPAVQDEVGDVTPRHWEALTKEFAALGRCSKSAHEGMRVHRDRVHRMPNSTVLNVWQPVSKQFVEIRGWNFMQHPCCPDYLWFTEVNGKRVG